MRAPLEVVERDEHAGATVMAAAARGSPFSDVDGRGQCVAHGGFRRSGAIELEDGGAAAAQARAPSSAGFDAGEARSGV